MSESVNPYRELLRLKGDAVIHHSRGAASYALCPDMGGRVFAEVGGLLKGSRLVSVTTFAKFRKSGEIESFLKETLGRPVPA